jgi:hypothetical protein
VDLCETTWRRVPNWKRNKAVIIITMPAVCYGINMFQAAFFFVRITALESFANN